MDNKELMLQADLLQGNVNRMLVTDDPIELHRNYTYALHRILTIMNEKEEILSNKEI